MAIPVILLLTAMAGDQPPARPVAHVQASAQAARQLAQQLTGIRTRARLLLAQSQRSVVRTGPLATLEHAATEALELLAQQPASSGTGRWGDELQATLDQLGAAADALAAELARSGTSPDEQETTYLGSGSSGATRGRGEAHRLIADARAARRRP